jgi:hypothetical protein
VYVKLFFFFFFFFFLFFDALYFLFNIIVCIADIFLFVVTYTDSICEHIIVTVVINNP